MAGLYAGVGSVLEYNSYTDNSLTLQRCYKTAMKTYSLLKEIPEEEYQYDPLSLSSLAQRIVANIADLRGVPKPWSKRASNPPLTPAATGAPIDLPKHPTPLRLDSVCLFDNCDVEFVRSLSNMSTIEEKIEAVASYMHASPYYAADKLDVHMMWHALRNALVIAYPSPSAIVIEDAHKEFNKRLQLQKDVLGIDAFDPDVIILAEAPSTARQWSVLYDYISAEEYPYKSTVDTDSSNQLVVMSRVLHKQDKALVEEACADFAKNYPTVDQDKLRTGRTIVVYTDTHVLIGVHARCSGDEHGTQLGNWLATLHRTASNRVEYTHLQVIITGDFNFMSRASEQQAQTRLQTYGLLCGNTTSPWRRQLDQKMSMYRTRSALGTDQQTKIDDENTHAKKGFVGAANSFKQDTWPRLAAGTLLAVCFVTIFTSNAAVRVIVAYVAYRTCVATQRATLKVQLYGTAKFGTPGKETPLDHLPLVVSVQPNAAVLANWWHYGVIAVCLYCLFA